MKSDEEIMKEFRKEHNFGRFESIKSDLAVLELMRRARQEATEKILKELDKMWNKCKKVKMERKTERKVVCVYAVREVSYEQIEELEKKIKNSNKR